MKKLLLTAMFSVLAFVAANAEQIGGISFSVPAGFESSGDADNKVISKDGCVISMRIVNSSSAKSAYNELYGSMDLKILDSSEEGVAGANEMSYAAAIQVGDGEYLGIQAFWGLNDSMADKCMDATETIADSLE